MPRGPPSTLKLPCLRHPQTWISIVHLLNGERAKAVFDRRSCCLIDSCVCCLGSFACSSQTKNWQGLMPIRMCEVHCPNRDSSSAGEDENLGQRFVQGVAVHQFPRDLQCLTLRVTNHDYLETQARQSETYLVWRLLSKVYVFLRPKGISNAMPLGPAVWGQHEHLRVQGCPKKREVSCVRFRMVSCLAP